MPLTREERLVQLVGMLLHELSHQVDPALYAAIERTIRCEGMGWALPNTIDHHDDDQWMTVAQLAYEFGYTPGGMRTRLWRSTLTAIDNRYRWADVRDLMENRGAVNDNDVIS